MISKAQRSRQAKRIQRALVAMYGEATQKKFSEIDEADVVKWVGANKNELIGIFTARGFDPGASKIAIETYLDTDVKPVMSVDQLKFLGQLLTEVDTSKIEDRMLVLFEKIKGAIGVDLYDRTKGMVPDAVKAMALLDHERIVRNGGKIIGEEEDLVALQYIAPIEKEHFKKVRDLLAKELNTTQKYLDTITELSQNLNDTKNDIKVLGISDLQQLLADLDTNKANVEKLARQSGSNVVVISSKEFKRQSDDLRKDIIEQFKIRMQKQDWEHVCHYPGHLSLLELLYVARAYELLLLHMPVKMDLEISRPYEL